MAFPSIPNNIYVQQGNNAVYLSWDISAGATGYQVYRSVDNVNFTLLASPTLNNYSDTTVTLGTQYFYTVASSNGSGNSPQSVSQGIIPAPVGEMSLGQLRLMSQQRADRVDSQFVTLPEWNSFINQAMYELYDLLITVYEDYFKAPNASFTCNGTQFIFPLPDGVSNAFTNDAGQQFVPPSFYKMLGLDLALNTAPNAYVTVNRYNFIDRNQYIYPNSSSTIYGVFNMRYRPMGNNLEMIPTPSGGQKLRLQYIPRLPVLIADTDLTTIGFSGWLQYVIIRAAKYALDKEESDTSTLTEELMYLKGRIEETAFNRDVGMADTISNTRDTMGWGGLGGGWSGPVGGWLVAPMGLLFPILSTNNIGNSPLANSVHFCQAGLRYCALSIVAAYLAYLNRGKLSRWISFSGIRDFLSSSSAPFISHIRHIVGLSTNKQVLGVDARSNVTLVTDQDALRNRPNQLLVEIPVRSHELLPRLSAGSNSSRRVRESNNTVSAVIDLSSPQPASISFINLVHESDHRVTHEPIVTANLRGVK